MEYISWPQLVDTDQRVLYTLLYGHLYKLVPHDDTDPQSRRCPLTLYRDDEVVATIEVEGKVSDFTVNHDVVAVATIHPAALYICRPWKGTAVLTLPLMLDSPDKSEQVIENITLGNYRGNIVVLWYGSTTAPVFVGMISGRDAFRFDPMPLVYYDSYGVQRMYIRKETERVLAVPHLPNQPGTIAIISPAGMKFYSLKPFYMMNPLSKDYITHMPFSLDAPYTEDFDTTQHMPARMQFSAYDLLVHINQNHLTMKYDPFQSARRSNQDWVRVFIDGAEVSPSKLVYLTPFDTDRTLVLEPTVTATDITIHADLPISFTTSNPAESLEVSQTGIRFLPKNAQRILTMRTIPCFTGRQVARFIEKYNLKIRAELWG